MGGRKDVYDGSPSLPPCPPGVPFRTKQRRDNPIHSQTNNTTHMHNPPKNAGGSNIHTKKYTQQHPKHQHTNTHQQTTIDRWDEEVARSALLAQREKTTGVKAPAALSQKQPTQQPKKVGGVGWGGVDGFGFVWFGLVWVV